MKKHIVPFLMIGISVLLWVVLWDKLPSSLPTHWGLNGEIDKWSSKSATFLLTNGLLIGVFLLFQILPKIDPRKRNYKKFSKPYLRILYSIMFLMFGISMGTLFMGMGHDFEMTKVITFILGIMFILIGKSMPHCEPNFFVGIRTPWTLSNDEVWEKTHRMGGNVYMLAGLLTLLSTYLPTNYTVLIIITIILIASLIPVVYSYVIYKKYFRE